ncbi:MAG: propanediol utilization protein [Candidatus Kerfeldbacteria bacterium]|nr:propanediol utilization protein [Candidatus Kerfeldbacteria bacterium]
MTTVPIEVSARHAHLSQSDWARLFGSDTPTVDHQLSQTPQFLARQRVTLVGPAGRLERVGVVGPFRPYTQVELASSDARQLGLTPPLSSSGQLDAAAKITIIGPAGSISVAAAIHQQRHLHMPTKQAAEAGWRDGQEVTVRVDDPRGGVFDHVIVRVAEESVWRMHVDTDEANAFGITQGTYGTVVR